jgi:hypothetical protein
MCVSYRFAEENFMKKPDLSQKPPPRTAHEVESDRIDEASDESFPASDPPSISGIRIGKPRRAD